MNEHQRWFWRMDPMQRDEFTFPEDPYAKKWWRRYETAYPIEAARIQFRTDMSIQEIIRKAFEEPLPAELVETGDAK